MRSPFVRPLAGKKVLSRLVSWTSWRPMRMARRVPGLQITLRGEGDWLVEPHHAVCRLPSYPRRLVTASSTACLAAPFGDASPFLGRMGRSLWSANERGHEVKASEMSSGSDSSHA